MRPDSRCTAVVDDAAGGAAASTAGARPHRIPAAVLASPHQIARRFPAPTVGIDTAVISSALQVIAGGEEAQGMAANRDSFGSNDFAGRCWGYTINNTPWGGELCT